MWHLPRPNPQKKAPNKTKSNIFPKAPKPNHVTEEAKPTITPKITIHRKGNKIEATFEKPHQTEPEEDPTANMPKLTHTPDAGDHSPIKTSPNGSPPPAPTIPSDLSTTSTSTRLSDQYQDPIRHLDAHLYLEASQNPPKNHSSMQLDRI